eukprot:scaffold622_cov335-Pavlova_lutheri.AAC.31
MRGGRTCTQEKSQFLNAWNQGVHALGTHPSIDRRLLRRCRTGGRAVPRRSLPRTCSIRSLPFGPGPNPVAALAKGGIERKDGRVRPNQPMGGRGEREPGGTNRSAQRKD